MVLMTLMTLEVQMTIGEIMVEDSLMETPGGMEIMVAEEIPEGMEMVVAEEIEVITIQMILVVVVLMDQILVTGVAEEE